MSDILIDTDIIAGLLIPRDWYHRHAVTFMNALPPDSYATVFPVLIELFHLAASRLDYPSAV